MWVMVPYTVYAGGFSPWAFSLLRFSCSTFLQRTENTQKHSVSGQLCLQNSMLMTNMKSGQTYKVRQFCTEAHFWMHNSLNFKADGFQHQRTGRGPLLTAKSKKSMLQWLWWNKWMTEKWNVDRRDKSLLQMKLIWILFKCQMSNLIVLVMKWSVDSSKTSGNPKMRWEYIYCLIIRPKTNQQERCGPVKTAWSKISYVAFVLEFRQSLKHYNTQA